LTVALAAALCLAAAWSGQGWAATEQSLYQSAEEARKTLEGDAKLQGLRHKWFGVIEGYEAVLKAYPEGKYTERTVLALGDLYLGLYKRSRRPSDVDESVKYFRGLIKTYPKSSLSARAQLKLGQIYLRYKGDQDRAYMELLKVELNFPGCKAEVQEARKLMAEISGASGIAVAEVQTGRQVETRATEKPAADQEKRAVISGLRHWHNPKYSRVAVDINREVKFRDHLLPRDAAANKPMRLYLDLEPATVAAKVPEEYPIADGLVSRARVGQYDQDTVRLVLDLQNIGNYRIFSLSNPFRIVVDVMGEDSKAAAPAQSAGRNGDTAEPSKAGRATEGRHAEPLTDLRDTASKRKKVPRGPAHDPTAAASLARQLGLGVSKVVIDPGHGGKDHGATGITGLREKDLTLRLARIVAEKIKTRLKLEVVLTRDEDVFLPLEERTARANTEGADLFISIHANAHKDAKVHGIETYFLNLATDEEAMRVAARENATTQKNMSDLQMILSDLMLNSKIAESGRLGSRVHKSMVKKVKAKYKNIRDLGLKQAPFYVLIGANMPSILVELGFISNATEESRLKGDRYVDVLTDGIVEAIRDYNAGIKKGG
jgi:N-acetylmuramoyl-L-alanine amidase